MNMHVLSNERQVDTLLTRNERGISNKSKSLLTGASRDGGAVTVSTPRLALISSTMLS